MKNRIFPMLAALAALSGPALTDPVSLGPILSISESDKDGPRPVYFAMAKAPSPRSVPIAMGEESVTANVSIVWQIQ